MLAIFDKSVAVCPDHLMKPYHNSVSVLDNGFLVNHFASLHPDHVVNDSGASAVFAYSLQESPDCPRFRFGLVDGILCMYQGSMEDVTSLRHKYTLNPLHDEVDIIIQAFKILRETGIQTPENVISDLIGDFSFIVYDISSKLLILASATSGFFPMFWGIDSESSLILSDDPDIVEKANLSMLQPFPSGHVYISRGGHGGLEAIFDDYTSEVEQQPLETEATYAASEIESWQPTCPPFFKVNTHGIAFPKEKMVGVIVRDSRGQMIVAGSNKIKGFTSHIHAHSLACSEGLTLMLKAGIRNVLWELVSCDTKNSAYARLSIPFVASLIKQFDAIGFSNVSMSANKAACGLAEYAKEVEDCIVWELEIPQCISCVVKLESQGHASTSNWVPSDRFWFPLFSGLCPSHCGFSMNQYLFVQNFQHHSVYQLFCYFM